MKKLSEGFKSRINGANALPFNMLKDDIQSIFNLSFSMDRLGFIYFFLGGKIYRKILLKKLKESYWNDDNNCFDFKGVRIPKLSGDEEIALLQEYRDILAPYIGDLYFYGENKNLYNEGPYEYKEIKIRPGDIVIDAGANIGLFSAIASIKTKNDDKIGGVYSFEPIPIVFKTLKKTSKLNKNIFVQPLALSDKSTSLEMSIGERTVLSTFVMSNNFTKNKIQIKTTTLDDFVNEKNLKRVDFIKADIEGAERLLLLGSKNVLKEFAPKISICTYHLPDDPKVLRDIILSINNKYVIYEKWKKMYAYVPDS